MDFVDISFPLKLDRLTYRVPDALRGEVPPGAVVRAEVKKSLRRGIVLGPSVRPPKGAIKDIDGLDGPGLGGGMARLLEWMAEYYFSPVGMVAKTVFPEEFFKPVKARKGRKQKRISEPFESYGSGSFGDAVHSVREAVRAGEYRAFLAHAPSTRAELSFAVEVARSEEGTVLIVAPEHDWLEFVEGTLREAVGEEALVMYHAGMSAGKRSEAIERMRGGGAGVVLASRYGVFAPVDRPSLIIVLNEESPWYKEEGGVRYNARDMAVMRAYLEGTTVLLSSIAPSVESVHNVHKGKYTLLELPSKHLRPRVRVVGMRGAEGAVSDTLRRAAVARLEKNEKVLLYVNRKGFSTLRCAECGHGEVCPSCGISMQYYKGNRSLHCSYCGREKKPPTSCPSCGGHDFIAAGAGLERVEEEIAALNPVGVERATRRRIETVAEAEGGGIAVGTKVLARSPELCGAFALAGVINADAHRYMPDFRSAERQVQELMYVADRVRPGGDLLLQSRSPRDRLFSYLRNFNLRRFYEAELRDREAAQYPPFAKLLLLTIEGEAEPALGRVRFKDVEVLGPVPESVRRGKQVWKMLLKAPGHAALKPAVEGIMVKLRGRTCHIDMDPVVV
jgi:primosomal protein N' (replication factor Y)